MKYLIVLVSIFLCLTPLALCQKDKKVHSIKYGEIINDIKQSKSVKDLKSKYDYDLVLFLDTTDINLISEIRPDVVDRFRKTFSESKSLNSKIISTDCKTIQSSIENFKKYRFAEYGDGRDARMTYPYYIKDDRIAVYVICGESWTECYRLTLLKNKLQIELLYLIVD